MAHGNCANLPTCSFFKPTKPAAVIAILMSSPAHAADKTVVLDVENADCVLCPPIVRQSLLRVKGVEDVKISQATQMGGLHGHDHL